MDKDEDGFITEAEFLEVMKNAPGDAQEYDSQKFFADADKNKDGKISFSEFADACQSMGLGVDSPISGEPTKKNPQEVNKIFSNFDIDGNGSISAKELHKVLSAQGESLTESEINDMIKAADTNNDNKVDREEFSKMI